MNQTDAKIEVLAELLFDLCRERAELLGKAADAVADEWEEALRDERSEDEQLDGLRRRFHDLDRRRGCAMLAAGHLREVRDLLSDLGS